VDSVLFLFGKTVPLLGNVCVAKQRANFLESAALGLWEQKIHGNDVEQARYDEQETSYSTGSQILRHLPNQKRV
jgi:hypothetical protein